MWEVAKTAVLSVNDDDASVGEEGEHIGEDRPDEGEFAVSGGQALKFDVVASKAFARQKLRERRRSSSFQTRSVLWWAPPLHEPTFYGC